MKQKIKDYDNYEIFDDGRIFNTLTQKFLKGSIGEHGYHYYRLFKNNSKKMFYTHRLVAEAFLDNPNNLPVVNHIDGNKQNNSITNLEWVSYSDNMEHWHSCLKQSKPRVTEYYTQDLKNEQWKIYKNYFVSSKGRIRHKIKNNLLKPSIACGYYKVRLSEKGLVEDCMVHQLVYQLFGSEKITENKVIDHIDGNKLNNDIDNLRLITLSENVLNALYQQKTNSSEKEVYQYDLNGKFIQKFPSAAEAARQLKLDSSTITKVCRGKNKTHGGFVFKYTQN